MSLLSFALAAGLVGGVVSWCLSERVVARRLHLQSLEQLSHSDRLVRAERIARRAVATGVEELEQLPIVQEVLHDLPTLMPQPPMPAAETVPLAPLEEIAVAEPPEATLPSTLNRSQKYANSFIYTRPHRASPITKS